MVLSIVVVAGLALGALALIARPFLAPEPSRGLPGPEAGRAEIEDALARSLDAINEIAFDHEAGNLSDEDFAELDAQERARALALLRRTDDLEK
jgi:hypothetical protein